MFWNEAASTPIKLFLVLYFMNADSSKQSKKKMKRQIFLTSSMVIQTHLERKSYLLAAIII